jgi:DNA repair protein RecN (Recombination protein N)
VRADLQALERSEARLGELEQMLTASHRDLAGRAERLSAARRRTAPRLQEAILAEIRELGMAKAAFEVRVTPAQSGAEALGPHGMDEVEFLISPNPGEPPKPLHKIASGGELSRTMLAIRVILAAADQMPTLIFDEVDAGIGGGVADRVGAVLAQLAEAHQVLCITHLPQIAARGACHLVVRKDRGGAVRVERVEGKARVEEIARMAGGETVGDATRKHARALLDAARRA